MTTDKIRDQLIDYNRQFKKNSGHFKSFEVIFDYIYFLKSEPYLKKLLAPLLAYANKQIELMTETAKNPEKSQALNNLNLDILNPPSFSEMPIFNKEFNGWQKSLEKKEDVAIMSILPINLVCLILVANGMRDIKDCQKAGDYKRAKELIKVAEEESFSIMPAHNIKNIPNFALTSAQFLDMSMELVNKYILDKIDAQAFLENLKPKSAVSFDKDKSILYIRGQEIKITRKNDKPYDHYILEAIFDQENFIEETYFKQIAEKYLGMNDYDKTKDWQKLRHACDQLNTKIAKATDKNITDFIIHTSGKTAWCKINSKYL
ncbi:MAG: hypothetical protein WC349_04525 [Patescibacteria group bacterium]|jgi:hypothetical protein